ncbi:MAG: TonB C-terminal domain-containing protein [Candidatus Omnitrophica bacterium]|nr:TonB C-terminal domain-containing protein [Candidatus Omnitrophota bacterium]
MIKVRYLKREELQPLVKHNSGKTHPKPDPFLKLDSKITKRTQGIKVPPPYVERENVFKASKVLANKSPEFAKPTFVSSDIIAIKKRITLPDIEMARINNPSYISYYQIVREKIRRSAYQNYTHNEIGEVYISFIISNDGYIKDVHLIETKTSASDYLKGIASRSVKDASPFPNFPKELDYPQLSFNIIISFEIE